MANGKWESAGFNGYAIQFRDAKGWVRAIIYSDCKDLYRLIAPLGTSIRPKEFYDMNLRKLKAKARRELREARLG